MSVIAESSWMPDINNSVLFSSCIFVISALTSNDDIPFRRRCPSLANWGNGIGPFREGSANILRTRHKLFEEISLGTLPFCLSETIRRDWHQLWLSEGNAMNLAIEYGQRRLTQTDADADITPSDSVDPATSQFSNANDLSLLLLERSFAIRHIDINVIRSFGGYCQYRAWSTRRHPSAFWCSDWIFCLYHCVT